MSTQAPFAVKALYDYELEQEDDLPFEVGQIIKVTEVCDEQWYFGEYEKGAQLIQGMFPRNYVEAAPERPQAAQGAQVPAAAPAAAAAQASQAQAAPAATPQDLPEVPKPKAAPIEDDWSDVEAQSTPVTTATARAPTHATTAPASASASAAHSAPTKADPAPANVSVPASASADLESKVSDLELKEAKPATTREPATTHEPAPTQPHAESLSSNFKNRRGIFNQAQAEEEPSAPLVKRTTNPQKLQKFAYEEEKSTYKSDFNSEEARPRVSIKERLALIQKQEQEMQQREEQERKRREVDDEALMVEEERRNKELEAQEPPSPPVEEHETAANAAPAAAPAAPNAHSSEKPPPIPITQGRAPDTQGRAPEEEPPTSKSMDNEEEARKVALRERMARISGMGAAGGLSLGMMLGRNPNAPGGGAGAPRKPKKKDVSAMTDLERELYLASIEYDEQHGLPEDEAEAAEGVEGVEGAEGEGEQSEPVTDASRTEVNHEAVPSAPQVPPAVQRTPSSGAPPSVERTPSSGAPPSVERTPSSGAPVPPTVHRTNSAAGAPPVPGAPKRPQASFGPDTPETTRAVPLPTATSNEASSPVAATPASPPRPPRTTAGPISPKSPTSPPRPPRAPMSPPSKAPGVESPTGPTGPLETHVAPRVPLEGHAQATDTTGLATEENSSSEDETYSDASANPVPLRRPTPPHVPASAIPPSTQHPLQGRGLSDSETGYEADIDETDTLANTPQYTTLDPAASHSSAAPPPVPPVKSAPAKHAAPPPPPPAPLNTSAPAEAAPQSPLESSVSPSAVPNRAPLSRQAPPPVPKTTRAPPAVPGAPGAPPAVPVSAPTAGAPPPPSASHSATHVAPHAPPPAPGPAPPAPTGAPPAPAGTPPAPAAKRAPPPAPRAAPKIPAPTPAAAPAAPPTDAAPSAPIPVSAPPAPGPQSPGALQRSGSVKSRSSLDHAPRSSSGEIDLDLQSLWYTREDGVPSSIDPSKVLAEFEHEKFNKRGRVIVNHNVFILYSDLSQLHVYITYDAAEPANASSSQKYISAPKVDSADLEKYAKTIGSKLAALASKKEEVAPTSAFVKSLYKSVPEALAPIKGTFGYPIYENFGNASVNQHDSIRPGDVAVLVQANFTGAKSPLGKYHKTVANSVYIVQEFDGHKKKLRVFDHKKESFRLNDLHSGYVKIYRPVGRAIVGW